jgi:hypothetical protein
MPNTQKIPMVITDGLKKENDEIDKKAILRKIGKKRNVNESSSNINVRGF